MARRLLLTLACLSMVPMLAGPALAGCYPYVQTVVRVKRVVKKVKVAVPVAVPYAVYTPVYVAQTLPAPTVSYSISTPVAITATATTVAAAAVRAPAVAAVRAPAAAPAYAAPAASPCATGHDKLAGILVRLERRLAALEGGQPQEREPEQSDQGDARRLPAGQPDQGQYDVGALINRRCASCHESQVAGAKGGGVALTQGDRLTQFDLDAALKAVMEDRMPRGGPPLTQDEKYWLSVWVDQEKQQDAKQQTGAGE